MKILLKEDVDHLGSVGDEVDVRDGYARNFLIPNGKALQATPKNLKAYNHQKMVIQKRLQKLKVGAESIAEKIAGISLQVTKKVGSHGKLYGSVTSQELAAMLKAKGVDLDRRKIQLSEPIKKLGEFQVPVKLHPEVTVQIKLAVESENPPPEAAAEKPPAPATEGSTESPGDPAESSGETAAENGD
ncbi:MAG: 50S ribosomal protein L9 [Nitrospinaceae bacterium]